jgi:DNA-binding MarR family transcriptional regulator
VPDEAERVTDVPTRENLGFLLAKASQRWNGLLHERFVVAGYPEVRPSYGSILLPLYEEDGLRQGELGRRARLSKQTMTTMVRLLERDGLVERRPDPDDGRASRIYLTPRSRRFATVAASVLENLESQVGNQIGARRLAELADALKQLMALDG